VKRLRILIVDDERLARRRLRALLEARDDVEVVGESADGAGAVRDLLGLLPDLVFLDVRMPDMDGFEVLAALGGTPRPAVVFVTAYGDHALRAFEVHAVDYLLKPFEDERVGEAVERTLTRLHPRESTEMEGRLRALLAERGGALDADRLVVRSGARTTFLSPFEIDWIEADGSYVRLHVGPRAWLLRESLTRLEQRLAASGFQRIHRSTLVNLERVRETRHGTRGSLELVLEQGAVLVVSRRFRERVRNELRL
jgi:two-component system LytT family response regulator